MEFSLSNGMLFTSPLVAGPFLLLLGIYVWKNVEFGMALLTVGGFIVKATHFQSGVLAVGGEKTLLYPLVLYVGLCLFIQFRSFHFSSSILKYSVVMAAFLFVFSILISYSASPADEYSMPLKGIAELLLFEFVPFLYVLILSHHNLKLNRYLHYIFCVAAVITVLFGLQILDGVNRGIPKGDLRMVAVFGSYLGGGAIVACLCMIISLMNASVSAGLRKLGYSFLFLIASIVFFTSLTRIYFLGMGLVTGYLCAIIIPKQRWVFIFPLLLLMLSGVIAYIPSIDEIGGQNTYISAAVDRVRDTLSNALSSDSFRAKIL